MMAAVPMIIHSAELVREMSMPPSDSGTIGVISNCSIGPAARKSIISFFFPSPAGVFGRQFPDD